MNSRNTGRKQFDMLQSGETELNIAALKEDVCALGPGHRFVFWLQGCKNNCRGCMSPQWRPLEPRQILDIRDLFKAIWLTAERVELEGVSISGGEPFLQAGPLGYLLKYIRKYTDLGVIIYTGYEYSELLEVEKDGYIRVLDHTDLVIAGPYIEKLNDNRGIRGSSNQTFHYLTDRYLPIKERLEEGDREVELNFNKEESFLIGVPPKDLLQKFEELHSGNGGLNDDR